MKNADSFFNRGHRPQIDAKDFMDVDPDNHSLRPWQCEKSLKTLKVTLVGVPRPDLMGDDVVFEAYPGQARETHDQIYDRLARLASLEVLALEGNHYHHMSGCLEMSLESGLDKLSGLKLLRELDTNGLRTKIGVKEVQWMTEHWPRLRVVRGLGANEDEAAEWLEKIPQG
jgi:hypothetical protein